MRNHLLPALGAGLVVVVAHAAACSDGQLGQAQLETPCAATDADCSGEEARAPIASGARFDLVVAPRLSGALAVPLLHLRPVDDDVVGLDDGVLVAGKPGLTAVLLLTDNDEVVDVVHVAVQKAEKLTLHRSLQQGVVVDERPLPSSIEVFPNEELTLRLNVWAGAQQLGGDTDDVWTSSDPAFQIIHQGFARERRLRAPAAGSTDVVVALPTGLSTTVHLEVIP